MRTFFSSATAFLVALIVGVATATPPTPTLLQVDGVPVGIAFGPSPDHDLFDTTGAPLVSGYRVVILQGTARVRIVDVGKPTPINGEIEIRQASLFDGLATGTYAVHAAAFNAGGESLSAGVPLTIEGTEPPPPPPPATLTFTLISGSLPVAGYDPIVTGASVTRTSTTMTFSVRVNTSVDAPVTIGVKGPGINRGSTENVAPYAAFGDQDGVYHEFPLNLGTYEVTATQSTTTAFVTFTVVDAPPPPPPPDTTAPSVTLAFDVATLAGQVSATDTSPIVAVEVLLDEIMIATSASVPLPFQLTATPAVGTHELRARVTDAAGNVGLASRFFTVEPPPPPPADTTPPDVGLTFNASTREGSVTATDASPIAAVEVLLDGVRVVSGMAVPLMFTLEAPAPGTHTLAARVMDAAGNQGEASLTFVVEAPPPPPPPPTGCPGLDISVGAWPTNVSGKQTQGRYTPVYTPADVELEVSWIAAGDRVTGVRIRSLSRGCETVKPRPQ